ncbi:MAG: N-acetylglucosamine-6-phosphate deacetylase [Clostridiales bacterium]|nr:N-acetylglucosamine-6-phosphate deacetylase [Clostridiales bacterium]
MKCFKNVTVYEAGKGLRVRTVEFDEKIVKIGKKSKAEEITLPKGAILLPGFIDQHIHGAGGSDGMDGTTEDIATIAKTLVKEGTTSFLVTTMTQSKEKITTAMQAVKSYREQNNEDGARVVGVHLEGPFIASSYKGAQPLEYVKLPDIATFEEYNRASGNAIKIVTLAPEVDGAMDFIRYLSANGVVASIGHTGAKFSEIEKAVEAGAKGVTHTYNAQTALHHREIGAVGSAMLLEELHCELIADTIHVSVPAMRLLVKNKPLDKLTLITDAMRAKGIPDGVSELGGQTVYVKNGEARLEDGTLAGSVLRMNRAIQNMVEKVGVPFTQAVDCATLNPAKTLGIDKETGSIAVGKRADFTVLNENYDVILTVVGGKVVYQA